MMLVEHGVDLYQIDQAVAAFGMTMGPFRMMDFVGFDVASAMKVQFSKNFGERFNELSKLIFVMQEAIQADETTRKGFYIYDGESKFTPNPDIKMYVNKARSISGLSIDYERHAAFLRTKLLSRHQISTLLLLQAWDSRNIGEESFSGLILLDQNIYAQNWRNGQRLMDRSSPAPI